MSHDPLAQVLANYANDLPLIDALVEEYRQNIEGLGASYPWTIRELRASAGAVQWRGEIPDPINPPPAPRAPLGDCRKCGGPFARADTECTYCGCPL